MFSRPCQNCPQFRTSGLEQRPPGALAFSFSLAKLGENVLQELCDLCGHLSDLVQQFFYSLLLSELIWYVCLVFPVLGEEYCGLFRISSALSTLIWHYPS